MKFKLVLTLLMVFSLFIVGCASNDSNVSDIKDLIDQQLSSNNSDTESPESSVSDDEQSPYNIVSLGEFYNGLSRATVYIYDEGYYSSDAYSAGYSDGYFLYGYVDVEGKMVIEPIYRKAPEKIDGLALVEIYEGLNTYTTDIINSKGESVVPGLSDGTIQSFGEISEGMIWVKTVEKTFDGNIYTISYYNENGLAFSFKNAEIVKYYSNSEADSCSNFCNGYANLKIDGIERLITKDGNVLSFDAIGYDDLLNSRWDGPSTYIDIGILKVYGEYANVAIYMQRPDGYVTSKEAYGIIDYANNTISYCEWDKRYQNVKKWGDYLVVDGVVAERNLDNVIINIAEVFGIEKHMIDNINVSFEDKVITVAVLNKDYELFFAAVGFDGKTIIEPTQDIFISTNEFYNQHNSKGEELITFSDGLILAKDTKTKLWGYIDKNGDWYIEPQYETASAFSEGYAVVNNTQIINKNGEVILDFVK